MDLEILMKAIPVRQWIGDRSAEITSVCYDSRMCRPGSLFVAIPGLQADGHDFIPQAIRKGARAVVHERSLPLTPGDVPVIQVVDSRRALGMIGRNFYRHPSSRLCLLGVIGTNGKTTVTYLLESILTAAGCRVGVLGTVNYRYGGKIMTAPNTTPESLEMQRMLREMADDGITHVVAEVSSHSIDLKRVDDCDFDLGIFTNLSQDHLDYHGNMENYFAAKKRFFQEILLASRKEIRCRMVVNGDDAWGRRLLREVHLQHLTFGMDTPCDVEARDISLTLGDIRAALVTAERRFNVVSPLTGKFNLYNILAAAAACLALGIPPETIQTGIEHFGQVPGRMEKVSGPGQPAVFVDYAHTDDALRRVLQNLTAFKGAGRLITLFGCGGDRDRGKRPLMAQAAAAFSDQVILTSDNPRSEGPMEIIREIEAGFTSGEMKRVSSAFLAEQDDCDHCYAVIPDRGEAIEAAVASARSTDIVLIAGKGHEDYQILGSRRIPFDDRAHARSALGKWLQRRRS